MDLPIPEGPWTVEVQHIVHKTWADWREGRPGMEESFARDVADRMRRLGYKTRVARKLCSKRHSPYTCSNTRSQTSWNYTITSTTFYVWPGITVTVDNDEEVYARLSKRQLMILVETLDEVIGFWLGSAPMHEETEIRDYFTDLLEGS